MLDIQKVCSRHVSQTEAKGGGAFLFICLGDCSWGQIGLMVLSILLTCCCCCLAAACKSSSQETEEGEELEMRNNRNEQDVSTITDCDDCTKEGPCLYHS